MRIGARSRMGAWQFQEALAKGPVANDITKKATPESRLYAPRGKKQFPVRTED
jgi:hypothetical protein